MGQRIPVTLGNTAPLSLRLFQPGRIILVCEGGGQRGIFTTGVLDKSMRVQFNPFDLYLGTSTGAQSLSAYICNQSGCAHEIIMRCTTKREFFDPLRFVCRGSFIDLDWSVEATASQMPLQMDTTARLFDSGKSFYMCAYCQDDYAPNYFLLIKQNWLDVTRAFSATSGFYRSGVSPEGISYLGGGISDAIPVKETVRQGTETLVVIRTVPSQMYYTPQWFKHMERWPGDNSPQPLTDLVQHHETSYREIQQSIEKPPGQLRISEIYPPKPLHSIALSSRTSAPYEDYKPGRLCGRHSPTMVGKLLTKKTPLSHHLVPVVTPGSIAIPPAPAANDTLVVEMSDAPQTNDLASNNEDLA